MDAAQKLRTLGAATDDASLGRLALRAPFDAIVVEKHIALGEAVREDASVFTLSDLSRVWAELNVPARDLSQVRVGELVAVAAGTQQVGDAFDEPRPLQGGERAAERAGG